MFEAILHLPLDHKFYFNTKNHFLVSNYNNSYTYFNITIGLALKDRYTDGLVLNGSADISPLTDCAPYESSIKFRKIIKWTDRSDWLPFSFVKLH